jgi:hypothetical protein
VKRAAAGLAAVVVVLLAGCSSSPSRRAGRELIPSTTMRAPGSTASPTAPSTPAPTITSSSEALPPCAGSQFAGSVAGSEGAAGTIEVTIEAQLVAGPSCELDGYPSVQLVASGSPLPTVESEGGSLSFLSFPPQRVVLGVGEAARFNLGYSDVPVGTEPCPLTQAVLVTPTANAGSFRVNLELTACGRRIEVSPFYGASRAAGS